MIKNLLRCVWLGLTVHFTGSVFAATDTWTGLFGQVPLMGDFNWSSAQNWAEQSAPANDGSADIVFTGSVGLSPVMDASWNVHTVDFNAAAGAFICEGGGNTLTIQAGITND